MEESIKNRNHFRYTRSYGILSQAEREFYECNGYVILRKLIPLNIIEDCCKHFYNICEGRTPPPPLVMRERSLLKSGRNGRNIIYKDFVFAPIDAANCAVATWTAMEKADLENGCLFVIPGSHKLTVLDHSVDVNANAGFFVINNMAEFAAEPNRVSLIMDAGDTVLLHPLLIHGSWENKSDRFRKSITGHYCNGERKIGEGYNIGSVFLWNLQRSKCENKGVPFLSYKDFWLKQSKLLNKNKNKI